MTLGDIIKDYRNRNNLTIGEFADACSLSKGYISMLENNINPRNNKPISPTLPSISKVASGMGIELDTLLRMLDRKQPVQLTDDAGSSLTFKDDRDIAKDLDSIMEKLTAGEDGPASYNGEELSPEAAELFRDELEIALKRLKIINKEKYTPKKYKK